MKLIIGLGNPGIDYDNTRHNVGFAVADAIAKRASAGFRDKSKFSAHLAETTIENEKCIIVKPQTFYNDSGVAVRAVMDFYKLSTDDILVIHDDSVLDFGKVRIRQGGQDAGNNGLKSLHNHIGQDFWHIRVGTDNLIRRQIGDVNFVLGTFNRDEHEILSTWAVPVCLNIVDLFVTDSIEPTSYTFAK